ncbi:MAG: cyclic nucleotide-binding domain-containing protein [Labilithrix sp.]|nr:cyclic nucleotide-binding domain-containing protein [Labilithrix sp.]MCW5816439.1 cyclic nucleotide-binding domain-containing protein [Labilithrix sp.]
MADRVEELRVAWHKATEKNKPQDALRALVELEKLQPNEPQWSQRLGEAYRRTSQRNEAVEAFVRAFERYLAKGFLPRAIAMAKLVSTMDSARGDLLEKSLPKDAGPILTRPPPLPVNAPQAPKAGNTPPLPLAPRVGTSDAKPPPLPVRPVKLTPAPDVGADEVRFSDAGEASISVLLEDFSVSERIEVTPEPSATAEVSEAPTPVSLSDVEEVSDFDALKKMASFRLFAALSRDALVALTDAAELVEFVPSAMVIVKNELAFALYAIVSGTARVIVAGSPEIRLVEGDVFGESSLLDEGQRQADVKAESQLMTLKIDKTALERVMAKFPEVEDALFDLLARRLITNLMHTSPLFSAFDPAGRLELSQRFEVRRADAGTLLAERDRRSDGLYVILAGNVVQEPTDGEPIRIARGTAFGHASLMGGKSDVTIRAASEAVLLRMPSGQFASLAATYPPVLAYLAETANEPLPMSRR